MVALEAGDLAAPVLEIENLEKGGPIANADYFLANDNSVKELQADLHKLLPRIGIKD